MPRLIKVAVVDEIADGTMRTFDVEGRPVLLANVEGKIYAMDAMCSHEEWDLSEGELQGAKVTCAGHGAVWDLTTGTAEFDEPLPALKTYRTLVKDGFVYVEVD
ncbi:MAG: Rieske 2Fe-2S domain-containing protein [Candidatus Caldarchaeum sp.]|uniref:Rieske domain-containing protein n=1 Tax=Caldiarchaeum subterraneum TaxID=311458 RepID=A0A7C5QN85_CALS0